MLPLDHCDLLEITALPENIVMVAVVVVIVVVIVVVVLVVVVVVVMVVVAVVVVVVVRYPPTNMGCVGSDDVGGPDEDLTGVVVDEDTAALELELALSKARRLNQSRCVRRQNERDIVMSQAEDTDPSAAQYASTIELNSTSEFCRSLGEIPTLGLAGNRDEDDDEMSVRNYVLIIVSFSTYDNTIQNAIHLIKAECS